MGYWDQIGEEAKKHQHSRQRDWLGLLAWPAAIVFWVLVGSYLLKLFRII
jgi:hypothetical protein